MLIALCKAKRIDAMSAERCDVHHCPNCDGVLTLKRGKKVVAHFAHKPPYSCAWQNGESRPHLESKLLVQDAFRTRGLKAEVEYIINTLSGDRRADVLVWSPSKKMVAFELQHSSIDQKDLEKRSFSYAEAGIYQIWIPFIRQIVWNKGTPNEDCDWFVEKYSASQFDNWVHELNGDNGMWMYDPKEKLFWHARLAIHNRWIEEQTIYSEEGEEQCFGGYFKPAKRQKELSLSGPHSLKNLKIKLEIRKKFSMKYFDWPKGGIAKLVAA